MSPLAKAVDDYLHLRRALGFKLRPPDLRDFSMTLSFPY